MKVTTTTYFDESKYEVIGVVDSINTRAISEFRQAFAQLTSIFGGKNDALNSRVLKSRDDALNELKTKAEAMGADMLVGVSLTTSVIDMGGVDFIVYAGLGTALKSKVGSVGGKRRKTLRKTDLKK